MILSLQLFRLDRCLSPPAPRSLSPSRESLRELCSRSELAHFIYLTCIIAPEMNKKKSRIVRTYGKCYCSDEQLLKGFVGMPIALFKKWLIFEQVVSQTVREQP
jgi:hypothetical protein